MSTPETERTVETPQGPGRLVLSGDPTAETVLLLGHGAGGGIGAPDLVALADQLPRPGLAVVRFEQPWRTAGKKVAPRPDRLDEAWRLAVAELRAWLEPQHLVVGGRSAGARVACRTAVELDAEKVVALAFPMHLPGRETSRDGELLAAGVTALVVQGSRDPMGSAEEMHAVLAGRDGFDLHIVPGAGHELTVGKKAVRGTDEMLTEVVRVVAEFIS